MPFGPIKRTERTRKLAATVLCLCFLTSALFGVLPERTSSHVATPGPELAASILDPLGHFEGSGTPASISWTGDGNRIGNPSFEAGSFSPWIPIQYDAGPGSAATVSKTAYDGQNSTQLALLSGNLTSKSYLSLLQDLGQKHVGLGSSLRFRAAVMVQQLTGLSDSDRVSITLNLPTSTGPTRAIHYVFDQGSVLFKTVVYDSNNDGNYTIGEPVIYGLAPANRTILSVDPYVKFVDSPPAAAPNSAGLWSPGEPVIYDADGSGNYFPGNLVVAGTAPTVATNLSIDPKIKFVDTPPSLTPNGIGTVILGNTASDAYIIVPAFGETGQWLRIDRNISSDASTAFPSGYSTVNSVSMVTLNVLALTQPGPPNHDPHIKYWNFNTTQFQHWQSGLTVVYDANNNGVYDDGDYVLGGCSPPPCSTPPTATPLTDDPLIKYVDPDGNDVWDPGESIVYDGNTLISNNGIWDFYDPVIAGPTPPVGALLMKIVQNRTTALFDKIELYSATGGSEWVKNGGFETSLTGWTANSSLTGSTFHLSGAASAKGTATNEAIEMTQSIDGRPLIDSSTLFKASANIASMSGSLPSNMVDMWLGLVDSHYSPVSLYYVFKTGDGNPPNNNTNTIYRKVNGFGALNQWLTVSENLTQETAAFNMLGFVPPYSIEVIVIEVVSQGAASTTIAYFDDLSIKTGSHTGTAPATFYAADGLNTTTVYTATSIAQGALHLEIPRGEAILNITSPEGTLLQQNEYTTAVIASCTISPCVPNPRAIDIPDSTLFKHMPVGNWQVFATSTNTIVTVYAENPTSRNPSGDVNVGSPINLVSRSEDPFGQPLAGIPVNLTLWTMSNGAKSAEWIGSTNALGWWNVSSVTLPPIGSPAGLYTLQATILAPYPGIRTAQLSIRYSVTVSITLSSPQIRQGSQIIISGTVTPTGASSPSTGFNVTISYRAAGNSQWTILESVRTDPSGTFTFAWQPPSGEYELIASTGDTQTAPSQSTRANFTVGPGGTTQEPFLSLVAVAAAAILALVAIVLLRKRRTQTAKKLN